ncbi:hypothetical protein BKA80DRAFT_75335 [Phyllosticta citrichinensis]
MASPQSRAFHMPPPALAMAMMAGTPVASPHTPRSSPLDSTPLHSTSNQVSPCPRPSTSTSVSICLQYSSPSTRPLLTASRHPASSRHNAVPATSSNNPSFQPMSHRINTTPAARAQRHVPLPSPNLVHSSPFTSVTFSKTLQCHLARPCFIASAHQKRPLNSFFLFSLFKLACPSPCRCARAPL